MGASATASFLATLLVHAALWFAAAWGLARTLRSAVWRARLWRGAVLGGVLSAALALGLDTTRLEWSWSRASTPLPLLSAATEASGEGVPIVLSGAAPASEPTAARTSAPESAAVAWNWSEVAVCVWALGALAALARLALDRSRLTRALARRRPLSDATWRNDLRELSRSAGLARAPRLSVAEGLSSPLALARGEVVVPARALGELARDEQRALLAHELAHLARRDPHWLAALGVVERVFWFQPLLRAASRRAGAAAELCCDEAAARWTGAGVALARCLASVAGWVGARAPERVAVAMAARGSALVERVERLLAPQRARAFEGALCATCAVLLLAALACSGPTAREASGHELQDAEILRQQIEIIRQRIDPEGKQELGIDFVGGNRIQITLPIEGVELPRTEAPDDGEVERVLARLDDCPEAAIAFHVSFEDGRYATSVSVPDGHTLDLRADGSIWCKDMLLGDLAIKDDRLLTYHLQEIARCTGTSATTARLEIRLRDGVPFGSLQLVLAQAARPGTAIEHYEIVRVVQEGRDLVFERWNYSLPVDGGAIDPKRDLGLDVRLEVLRDANGRRSLRYSFRGLKGQSQVRGPEPGKSQLKEQIGWAAEPGADVPVGIDAYPGTLYGDVRVVLEAVLEAGFTDIRFVGLREER
jgi:beta-lactamase regulating signal transducer with metallopeptidase domain